MEKLDVIQDIAVRTSGDVFIGVVGPVRTGKSTFIKRFMDLLVLPRIKDAYDRQRAQDELPQSGAGRTIMTTQPLFVPDQPVTLEFNGARARVRLVDCVGYTVPGARGYEDEQGPRLVRTPWFDRDIPFQEAAELGTRKVIEEHATIGIVITTDGTVADLPRQAYVEAEQRVINELKALGKPFLVLLNSVEPEARSVQELAEELSQQYGVTVVPINCLRMSQQDALDVLHEILFEFPVQELSVRLPAWIDELPADHPLRRQFLDAAWETIAPVERLRDVEQAVASLAAYEFVETVTLKQMELGQGTATVEVGTRRALFYKVLAEMTGFQVAGDHHLVRLMQDLAVAKREYDKVAAALADVRTAGYGIVTPSLEDIAFDEPEIIRQGGRFGVKLRAGAPSIHMVRADIYTEVTPFVGTEKQGEEFVRYLTEEFEKDPGSVWNSDFLGKSLQDLVREGIQSKLHRMPEHAQKKLQETLTKIINEGSGGLICFIL
ncbi:MAG: stage IV sporulation protein A [Firmicutes bacterium ZCTH02-B6]|nr:MAG: stage IV sporulation protein A [Firmicutes bacterium ZCTH02-B6]